MKNTRKHFYLFILMFPLMGLSSCYLDSDGPSGRIKGEGPVEIRELDLSKINGIVIRNSANVKLNQGDRQKIFVEGQENILDNLKTEVNDRILYISYRRPVWRSSAVEFRITLPEIELVRISGSGNISTTGKFEDQDFVDARLSGSGTISLSLYASEIKARISGSGKINLDGKARDAEYEITGSGNIHASEMRAKDVYARISGSGGIHLFADDELEARIGGSGSINYQGNPEVYQRVTGSGSVRKR